MIIDCISDCHGFYPKLEGGDLLIVAGDLTARHTVRELDEFNEWLLQQRYEKKVVIAGNHDTLIEDRGIFDISNPIDRTLFLDPSADYLCDSGTEFEGIKIWGTPWSLWFKGVNPHCAAFMGYEGDLQKKYDLIPNDIDILISHTPPYGILDQNKDGYLCGSMYLRNTLDRVKPKFLICGHIHERGGQQIRCNGSGAWCINASIVNEKYQHVNKPVRLNYSKISYSCSEKSYNSTSKENLPVEKE